MNALQTRFAVGSVAEGGDGLFGRRMKGKKAGRARPQTAKPRSRASSYVVNSNSSARQVPRRGVGASRVRPRTAPSRRRRTAQDKTMELAQKQSNYMRLVMQESTRMKGLKEKIDRTKAKIVRTRSSLARMAKRKLINARFASEHLRQKDSKTISIKEIELDGLKRKNSQLSIQNEAIRKKCDDLRVYSKTLETMFERTKTGYLSSQQEYAELMKQAQETSEIINDTKHDKVAVLENDEDECEAFDEQMDNMKKYVRELVAKNQVEQEREVERIIKQGSAPRKNLHKNSLAGFGGLFSKTLKSGLGKMMGRKFSNASSLSASMGSPGGSRIRPKKQFPPVEPELIYNQFLKLVRAREPAFAPHDVRSLRSCSWEEVRVSQHFVETFNGGIRKDDEEMVDQIKTLQILKENVELQRKAARDARLRLKKYSAEHAESSSLWERKVKQLRSILQGVKATNFKESARLSDTSQAVNRTSDMVLKLLKDISTSSHLKELAKNRRTKKRMGKLQLTDDQKEERALWEVLETRKANSEPPLLKETIRGMEILESHVYDLLDIVASLRPDLLKDPDTIYSSGLGISPTHGRYSGFKQDPRYGGVGGSPHPGLSINTSGTFKRSSYFGPPSAQGKSTRELKNVDVQDVDNVDVVPLPLHNVFSTEDLRKQLAQTDLRAWAADRTF
jgi:hypothetical protein